MRAALAVHCSKGKSGDGLVDIKSALGAAISKAGVVGAVAIVGDRDGVRFEGAYGSQDPAASKPMTLDTMFQLASMTKAVTSVAAMQLVERGLLSLDAPIGDLLPALAKPMVITGFAGDGSANLRDASGPITLRHLLSHTSGLGYDFVSETQARARGADGSPTPGTFASITTPLLFDPGTAWEYGVSTDWVGLAVEAASGQRLDAYVAQHITGPLGMTDSSFTLTDAQRVRLAALHARQGDGSLAPAPLRIGSSPRDEFPGGGGGMYGTAGDYLRFARMILNDGNLDGVRILSPESIAGMSRNQIGGLRAGTMATVVRAFSLEIDVFPGMDSKWGLGFLINPEPGPNGRAPGSLAWAGIANTYYWIDPASGTAAVLMMQFLPFGDPAALEVYAAFERLVYAA